MSTWVVIVIVLLVALAGMAAMADTAISRMTRVKAHHLAQERKGRSAVSLVKLLDDPAPYLNVVLLVSVAAQVTGTALAAALAIDRFGNRGLTVAAAAMTFGLFVLAQVVPRTITVQRPEGVALKLALPTYLMGRLLHPLGRFMILVANAVMGLLPGKGLPKGPFVTEDEIRHLIDVAEEEEEIEEDERELIHSVFEFGDTVVREVMVPRPDMVALKADTSLTNALETIIEAGYSRIPIFEGDTDNIIGMLYAKDLLKRIHEADGEDKVVGLGRAPLFVPEQKKVAELLREMQNQRVHMAIVVDEYGGTAGLVTIEDLIEEIVGEIVDEYDQEEPLVEPIDPVTIRVDAKMSIEEVNELLDLELPHEEWDTVGGLVFGLTGRVPVPGETVTFDSIEFRTERVTGRRINKVVITKKQPAEEPAEG